MIAADEKITEAQSELDRAFIELAEREQDLLCREEANIFATEENAALTRKLLMARSQLHAESQKDTFSSYLTEVKELYATRIRDLEAEMEERQKEHDEKTAHLKSLFLQMQEASRVASSNRSQALRSELAPLLDNIGMDRRRGFSTVPTEKGTKHYYVALSDLRNAAKEINKATPVLRVRRIW